MTLKLLFPGDHVCPLPSFTTNSIDEDCAECGFSRADHEDAIAKRKVRNYFVSRRDEAHPSIAKFDLYKIIFTKQLSAKAGFCYYDKPVIVMNRTLCSTSKRYSDTLFHELAHAVTHILYGKFASHHGPEWRRVMTDLGQDPSRTYSYDLVEAMPGRYVNLECIGCGQSTSITKKRAARGIQFFRSTCCRKPFKLSGS